MYTTASVFFKTLADAGITHAFVNWGSDHPAFLEDLQRQRVENEGKTLVEIVTCPSEYVALSVAHSYAQVSGKPAAVIVHVDVGTQSLAGAIHNADRGQVPVLLFAGSSPFTVHGELPGSRNEFILWLQDVPDQPAIVRQYMRHTAQIQSGKNAAKAIMRALQIATSDPKGPVYLWARREVTEEDVDDATMNSTISHKKWPTITMPALSAHAVDTITSALLQAEFPLIIASNSGRNAATFPLITWLSSTLAIGVLNSGGSAVSIPNNHPHYLGYTFAGNMPHLDKADVVLILNSDVPWVDVNNPTREGARIFAIDNDPLKRNLGWTHVEAEMLCTADTATALSQIYDALRTPGAQESLSSPAVSARLAERKAYLDSARSEWIAGLSAAESRLAPDGVTLTAPYVLGALRDVVKTHTTDSNKVIWMNEAVSNSGYVWNHIRPEAPGSMFMSGGSSIGWVLGGSIGAYIGAQVAGKGCELVVTVSGDGNFLFGVPTAAYWVAKRYATPFLTVVLNNRGWSSPKHSMRGVHPDGYGSRASGEKLSVGFGTDNVDYGGVAAAAGGAWARRITRGDEVRTVFDEAVKAVMHERRCAVVECIIESI